jgi:putative membrane fusion protein
LKQRIKRELRRYAAKYLPAVGIALLAVILTVYTLYICLDLSAVEVLTTPAVESTEYEIAGLTGYIFRDEEVLYSKNPGAAVYRAGDGEMVVVDTELARVYTYGSTADYLAERAVLEHKINLLGRSIEAGRQNAAVAAETKSRLKSVYTRIMKSLSGGDLSGAAALSDEMLVYLNAYGILTGKNNDLKGELDSLYNQLSELANSYAGEYDSIKNSRSGYFFYTCDGLEDIFDYGLIDTLTADGLDAIVSEAPKDEIPGKYAVGKMIYNYIWYLAVPADAYLCRKLHDAAECKITFPAEGLELRMTLHRISFREGDDRGVLIFSSGIMPKGFSWSRVQQIELLVSEITGLRVPEAAVHEEKGIKGVYILSSSQVVFRKIKIIYEGEGYYVVAPRDPEAENYKEYLDSGDQIIISVSDGKLYSGRIIN